METCLQSIQLHTQRVEHPRVTDSYAFATFMVLSYVKILDVSFSLLIPVQLKDVNGEAINETYLTQ